MLGRQVTAALRRPLHARLRVTATPQTQLNLCIRTFSYAPRLLESAGRPRKAVGEPSRPVKRAVKRAAKDPAAAKADAAAKKVAAKEKQRLAKEKALKKKAADKDKAKKTKVADAKRAKELARTPEQVERRQKALRNAAVKELKKAALDPPFPNTRLSSWTIFTREMGKINFPSASSTDESGLAGVHARLTLLGKQNSETWKNVTASELEHYNHIAHTEKEASIAEYKRWVESLSPEEVKLANTARRNLRRLLKGSSSKTLLKWRDIDDERAPKHPMSPYLCFNVSRNASGDFKNISVPERSKLVAQEWKALSADEKKKYEAISEQDHQRWQAEVQSYSSSPVSTA